MFIFIRKTMQNQNFILDDALYNSRKRKRLLAKAIIGHVRPTHFVTLSLVQGRQIIGQDGAGYWVRGDDVIYDGVHQGFIRSLSKRLVTKYAWRAHKPLLRSAYAMEGGRGGKRNHMHIVISKPDDVPEATFVDQVRRTAVYCSWIMNGDNSFDVQRIESSAKALGATFYSVKEGLDRVGMS